MVKRLLCVVLVLLAIALTATVTYREVRQYQQEPSWEELDPAQLSWVIEGIQERISELEDDLLRVQKLQREKLADTLPTVSPRS